jgi:hypothetical protein
MLLGLFFLCWRVALVIRDVYNWKNSVSFFLVALQILSFMFVFFYVSLAIFYIILWLMGILCVYGQYRCNEYYMFRSFLI